MPKFTDEVLIPADLLQTISCKCAKGCDSKRCGCRKLGLKCTNLCSNCQESENCTNSEDKGPVEDILSEEVEEEEPRNVALVSEDEESEDGESSSETEDLPESDNDIRPTKRQKVK